MTILKQQKQEGRGRAMRRLPWSCWLLLTVGFLFVTTHLNNPRRECGSFAAINRTDKELNTRYSSTAAIDQCLSLEETDKNDMAMVNTTTTDEKTLDIMIAQAKQIYIAMPAKAAGSSLKAFTSECAGIGMKNLPDNLLNSSPDTKKDVFTKELKVPSILSSHIYSDNAMVQLVKHSVRKTLLIYMHRDETDRVISAVRYIVPRHFCMKEPQTASVEVTLNNSTDCIVDELPLVNLIEEKKFEIGIGGNKILTCKTYDAIEDNAPDMVFIHYTKANQLQKLIPKHHCPDMMLKLKNVNTKKTVRGGKGLHVRLAQGGDIVNLESWLEEKAC